MTKEKGLFIVLEGVDNCGKTTQSNLLREYFERQGLPVVLTREPGGTEVGEKIRKILLERDRLLDSITQTLLFYASRREFVVNIVKPNVERGVNVISDRFEPSTFVYQGIVQGVHEDLLHSLHLYVVRGVPTHKKLGCEVDLCVVLDISAEESVRREANHDRSGQKLIFEKQGLKFLEKLRMGYSQYAKEYLALGDIRGQNAVVLDGMRPKEVIHHEIVNLVEDIRCGFVNNE